MNLFQPTNPMQAAHHSKTGRGTFPGSVPRVEARMRGIPTSVCHPARTPSHAVLCRDRMKETIRTRIIETLRSNATVPSHSAAVSQLRMRLSQGDVTLDEIAEVVQRDPALSSRCLSLVNSSSNHKKTTVNLRQALREVGIHNVRASTSCMAVNDRVRHVKTPVDWNLFRLHGVLVARLTERLAGAYREVNGKEYLAGLLHDIGKLFLEHHFPQEFDEVMNFATIRRCGMFEAERHVLGITHSEISALLCERWGLDGEIVRAIRLHHAQSFQAVPDLSASQHPQFLAACVAAADAIANLCGANIQGARVPAETDVESLPELVFLRQFAPLHSLEIDVAEELRQAGNV